MKLVMANKMSQDSMRFLAIKSLDKILLNQKGLSKCEILDVVADLRDEIDKFC